MKRYRKLFKDQPKLNEWKLRQISELVDEWETQITFQLWREFKDILDRKL